MIPALAAPPPGALSPQDGLPTADDAEGVADAFTGLFVGQLLAAMRRAAHVGGEPSLGTQTFEGMLDEELARSIARGDGLGLRALILGELAPKI